MIKVSPSLKWLLPYLEIAATILPPATRISRLQAWKLGGRCGKHVNACIYTEGSGSYRIYMHTHYRSSKTKQAKPFSRMDLVKLLAHELGHVADMEHSPAHGLLEANLQSAFMVQMKLDGYISEENELSA